MGYWSLAILVVSVSFLAYRHPEATRNALPLWLRRSKAQSISPAEEQSEPDVNDAKPSIESGAPSLQLSEPEEIELEEATPKSNATQPKEAVPSFSLSNNEEIDSNSNDVPPPKRRPLTLNLHQVLLLHHCLSHQCYHPQDRLPHR